MATPTRPALEEMELAAGDRLGHLLDSDDEEALAEKKRETKVTQVTHFRQGAGVRVRLFSFGRRLMGFWVRAPRGPVAAARVAMRAATKAARERGWVLDDDLPAQSLAKGAR